MRDRPALPDKLENEEDRTVKRTWIIVAGLAIWMSAGRASLVQAQTVTPAAATVSSPAQTRVALVNTVAIFQNYQKAKFYKTEIEKDLEPFRVKGETLRKEIIKWQNDLQDPKFDPKNREQWERGILANKRALEDLDREARKSLGKKQEVQVVQLYREVHEAIKRYASANNYHLVLAYGEPTEQDPFSFANIQRKVGGIEMGGGVNPIFIAPGLDISVAVVDLLNRQYTGGVQPTSANVPATGGTATPTPR